jgi:hypothetical protein
VTRNGEGVVCVRVATVEDEDAALRALPDFVQRTFPDVDRLGLSVNVRNDRARSVSDLSGRRQVELALHEDEQLAYR